MGRVPLGASPGHTDAMSDANPLIKAWHLAARFVTSLPPTPPSVDDEIWVDEHLLAGERSLWLQLSNQDRRLLPIFTTDNPRNQALAMPPPLDRGSHLGLVTQKPRGVAQNGFHGVRLGEDLDQPMHPVNTGDASNH